MGTANYYMKCRVDKKHMPKIRKFFKQGYEAEIFWQENKKEKSSSFWNTFSKKFPDIFRMLKEYGVAETDNISAFLNFGYEEKKPYWSNGIMFYSAEVWHFANWDIIAQYLKKHCGVTNVKWISDEFINFFDVLRV